MVSSTDNFCVGFLMGLKSNSTQQLVPMLPNLLIASCNASGALLATMVGESLGKSLTIAPILASIAFLFLAWQEVRGASTHHDGHKQQQPSALMVSLTLPMTLSNLAGGDAGAVTGVVPNTMAFIYAFLASVVAMACGHWLASRIMPKSQTDKTTSKMVALIYFVLLDTARSLSTKR